MSRSQTTIIWLGLLLVIANVVINWSEFRSVVFSGTSTTSDTTLLAANQSRPTSNTPVQTSQQTPSNVQV